MTKDEHPLDKSKRLGYAGYFEDAEKILHEVLMDSYGTIDGLSALFCLGWYSYNKGKNLQGSNLMNMGRLLGVYANKEPLAGRVLFNPNIHSLTDKVILLQGEGGAGDEIIFSRFAKVIKERGASKVIFSTSHGLKLLESVEGIDEVIDTKDIPTLGFNYYIPAMASLTCLELNEIPNAPYIPRTHNHTQNTPLKVGIRWAGAQHYAETLGRDIPPQELIDALTMEGVELYSFQKDGEVYSGVHTVNLDTWEDTQKALCDMDLIISSCTSIPHLSSAMGIPTWVITPTMPYFVWTKVGDTTPYKADWYENTLVYRRPTEDWTEVLDIVRFDLKQLVYDRINPGILD
jgi:hypothetical protein